MMIINKRFATTALALTGVFTQRLFQHVQTRSQHRNRCRCRCSRR